MAENLSIRINEETKALFNQLAEQGEFENKGDFLNRLMVLYQTEKTKEDTSMLAPAIEAVGTLTNRLLEILSGAGATITTTVEKYKREIDSQRTSFEEMRVLLQQRITALEQDHADDEDRIQSFISDNEAAESRADGLQQQIKRLEDTINDKTALIEEYKDKNDTLNIIIAEFKVASTENKALNETVNDYKHVNEGLQRQIEELELEIQKQADKTRAEQDNLKERLLLEKGRALLELKQEFQAKFEEQQTKHIAEINDYQNNYKDLLNLLEQKSTTAASRKKSTSTLKDDNLS